LKNKLIFKIVLSYLVLVAFAAPVMWYFLSGTVEGYFTDRIAENLLNQAGLIAGELTPLTGAGKLDALSRRYKSVTGARVTIIDGSGKVLGDSDEDSSKMENHIGRPEVQAAMVHGWGRATRYSHTIRIDMLYVAVAIKPGMPDGGYIRLSMPLHQVEEAMGRITRRVAAGAFVMFLAAIILGMYFSRQITSKVGDMAAFTREVASGGFERRLRAGGSDELGVLAGNLNEMAGQLSEKLDAITREKATLEAVLGGMTEGVLVSDKDGRVILVNRRVQEIFGLKKDAALGRPFLEVIRNAELLRLIRVAHERREVVTGEVEVQLPESLYFLAGCVPLVMKGEFAGAVLVIHDITRLKGLERVRRDFVANVTHELKTPISAIQGFSETLLAGAIDEKENARRFLGIIESNSRRLARLIEDLLTLSKIELGEVTLELKEVSLENVCREAAALLEPRIKEKALKLSLEFPGDTPKVKADRDKVYQVVLNVLDNAVKFTPEGGSVSMTAKSVEDGMVELAIRDTGSGVPPDLLPRIGERFFRVDPARSRELGGTGLGLAIVKHLMKAHDGTFAMDSYPQKGTTVTLGFKAAARHA
jgi:two-component system phosphate regulon sensor histidine kinase PhoR